MSRLQIGPAVLLVPEHAGTDVDTVDMTGAHQEAVEVAAVVAVPGTGVLLEVACQRWDGGGQCMVTSRGDSPPAYDRLVNRLRMSVMTNEDGTDFCELAVARWDEKNPFGSIRQARMPDLDEPLGSQASAFLVQAGALELGTRAEVLGDTGKRRNYLCARFLSGNVVGPLVALVVTRVVPMVREQGVPV